jgi:hypothetical protein
MTISTAMTEDDMAIVKRALAAGFELLAQGGLRAKTPA